MPKWSGRGMLSQRSVARRVQQLLDEVVADMPVEFEDEQSSVVLETDGLSKLAFVDATNQGEDDPEAIRGATIEYLHVQKAGLSKDEKLDLILQRLDQLDDARAKDQAETRRLLGAVMKQMKQPVAGTSNAQNTAEVDMEFDFGNMFPLKTKYCMEMFETSLGTDKEFRSKMAHRLRRFGGRDGKAIARNMSKFMFSDEMNIAYSWAGTTTKSSFSKNKELLDLMLSVIREKEIDFTEIDLNRFFQENLKHTKARLKRHHAGEDD